MALVKRKSAEEKAAREAEREIAKREAAIERERRTFFATPAGQARIVYDRGDQVFQCTYDVMGQQAVVVAMIGSASPRRTSDPTEILNSVCHEGWELVSGSFVFVQHGQQSRDKFMSSGQNIAVSGTTVGYYLFKRAESNKREVGNPWDAPEVEDDGTGLESRDG